MTLFVDSAVRSCDCDGALEQLRLQCHDLLLLPWHGVCRALSGFQGVLGGQMWEAAGVMCCGQSARASFGLPLHCVFRGRRFCCAVFLEACVSFWRLWAVHLSI